MRLGDLLQHIEPLKVDGDPGMEIQGLYCDSRQVRPGGLFFALRGTLADGHRFIGNAVQAGAVAVVVEHEGTVPAGTSRIVVRDARKAMALAATEAAGVPSGTRFTAGIFVPASSAAGTEPGPR